MILFCSILQDLKRPKDCPQCFKFWSSPGSVQFGQRGRGASETDDVKSDGCLSNRHVFVHPSTDRIRDRHLLIQATYLVIILALTAQSLLEDLSIAITVYGKLSNRLAGPIFVTRLAQECPFPQLQTTITSTTNVPPDLCSARTRSEESPLDSIMSAAVMVRSTQAEAPSQMLAPRVRTLLSRLPFRKSLSS